MALETHMIDIAAGKVTKTNVTGIRKVLNARARFDRNLLVSSTAPVVSHDKIDAALDALGRNPPRVVGELHDTGLKQLQSRRYRKQLSSVADIVADIVEFRLVGFETVGRHELHHTPIYSARDSKGRSFTFINLPWQSGGNGPEVISY